MPEMLSQERQAIICERLGREGKVVAGALAREFAVSEDTIRRDLRELAAAGRCARVYGGALPIMPPPPQHPFKERRDADRSLKAALGEAAAALVPPGSTVFIDAGSTNVAVAESLARRGERFTVVTHSPAVAVAVATGEATETILLGGRLDRETGACLGAKTLIELQGLRPDIMILGACGADPLAGITAFSFEDAEIKRCVAGTARTVMVVASADKLGLGAPFVVLPAGRLGHLVTQSAADDDVLSRFEANGTTVTRVPFPAA